MKPVLFAVIAMLLYAVSNTLIETKLSKYNTFSLIICYTSVVLIFSLLGRLTTKTPEASFNFPIGTDLLLALLLGVIMAVAEYFYVGAYTNHGSVITVTSIVIMLPIFAIGIKFLMGIGSMPNIWQVTGYIFAMLAILCISKGSLPK